MRPLGDRLGLGLREPIVDHASPVLVDAVIASGSQQLFGSHQSQAVEIVRRHHVGAAFAAIQRQQRHPRALAARFVGQHAAVLIVGVRGDHDQAGARVQLLQALPKRRRTSVDGQLGALGELDRRIVRGLGEEHRRKQQGKGKAKISHHKGCSESVEDCLSRTALAFQTARSPPDSELRNLAAGGSARELEIELQPELNLTRVANGGSYDTEPARSECEGAKNELGFEKLAWLNALNISARNSNRMLSLIGTILKKLRSTLVKPGP